MSRHTCQDHGCSHLSLAVRGKGHVWPADLTDAFVLARLGDDDMKAGVLGIGAALRDSREVSACSA